MGFGSVIDALVQRDRAAELATSNQLLLGEFILKLQAITDKTKPVVFDTGDCVTRLRSWRGRYAELALGFAKEGVVSPTEVVLNDAELAVGKTFEGYKGGDFVMGRGTPIWMANYGETSHDYDSHCYRMLTGVREETDRVVITTALAECY